MISDVLMHFSRFFISVIIFLFSISAYLPAYADPIVQIFYIPITEEQIRAWEDGIYGGAIGNEVNTVISITATYHDTVIYYDQWEDGYENDIATPVQSTTLIWGDGNAANGAPPGCFSSACDHVNAGTVIALQNEVPANPRDQGAIFFDARDKFASTGQLVVTRAGWATDPGTVFAGAVEVFDVRKWSTSHESPIGTNSPSAIVGNMFTYAAMSILAKDDDTNVMVDSNADGTTDITVTLDEGETIMVPNIFQGATVNASAPVQVDLMTGQTGSNVVGRWLSLVHRDEWGSSYYSPVMTTSAQTNAVILYNPDPSSTVTVNIETASGLQTPLNIGPRQIGRFNLTNSAAHFYTTGAPIFGVLIGDYNSSTGATYEWGAMLVPEQNLTPSVIVGWAPGSDGSPPVQNISPVWVTPVADTTIYVDYDGNPSTGPNTDPAGNRYDVSYSMTALQSRRIYDGDFSMTGARIYTTDGVRLAAIWGQDASSGVQASPAIDLGTAVLPFPSLTAYKTSLLIGDYNNNGGLDPGELLEYTVRVHNSGIYPITDVTLTDTLDSDVTYVADTSAVNGVPVPDNMLPDTRFPFDGAGRIIVSSPSWLNPGDDIFITFQVTVNSSIPQGKEFIVNNAKVESIAEVFLNSMTALVREGALQTTMTSSVPPGAVEPGDTITYTVTVRNISSATQTGIQLSGPLPEGTAYVPNSTTVIGYRQKYVADRFNQLLYDNNDGPESWSGNWNENDAAGGGSAGGNVQVINGSLRLNVTGSSATRTVDLTTGVPGEVFSSATLTFDFRTSPGVDAADAVVAEISGDGASFTTLETLTGISGQTSGTRSYDLSSYISGNTTLRFRISGGYSGSNEYFYPDNIVIKTDILPAPVTRDNAAGTYPDLIGGNPPALILSGDGFSLTPGEAMTVTYRVTANNPINETRIVNTVSATSHEKAPLASATTIDPVGPGGTIGGLIWLDTVANGAHEYGEPGLYNVRTWLDANGNGVFDPATDIETRTGTDGKYLFAGLQPGVYQVFADEITIPAGLVLTTGTTNPCPPVTITTFEEFLNTDFGYRNGGPGVAVIGNYVWSDADNDGIQDPGETGIDGVAMQLVTSPGGAIVQTTTTNAFGSYLFTNVAPGTYVVRSDTEGILATYTPSAGPQSIGSVDSDPLSVAGGYSYVMMDFGYHNPSLSSVSNRLWFDTNDNGVFDAGEPGIKDVSITLLDSSGEVMGATLSGVDGNFSFHGVPNGNFTIHIEDAGGKLTGFAGTTAAAQNRLLPVAVAGLDVSGTAFGYNAPGRIGDSVWSDLDRDGIHDTGEAGIQGVSLQLYKDENGDGVFDPAVDVLISSTASDADGSYMFQVSEAGRFFVNVSEGQPVFAGMSPTTPDDEPYQGLQRQIDFMTLNTSFLSADFGFGGPAVISGKVWNDANRSGAYDTGESGIQAIAVKLYKDTNADNVFNPAVDQLVSALFTDFYGNYAFTPGEAGRFFISLYENQTPLLGMILTTTDDQAYQGAQLTAYLPDANTFFTSGDFGFGVPAASALTVTKAANPAGEVHPGNPVTYTVTVTNTSTNRQTGIRIYDPLPEHTTYVSGSTSATGPTAGSSAAIADDFESAGYSGGDGWAGSWTELGDDGNPSNGDVRIVTDSDDNSTRIRQTGNGLSRQLNLSSCASATATFDYRRQGFDGSSDYVAFSVYNGAGWTEVARFAGPGTDPNYIGSSGYNINTNTSQIRFFSSGLNNQDYFYVDNIRIVCTIPKSTVTKTNQTSSPNPLADGNPSNLVVPADGFILDQNDSLTVVYQVTANDPLTDDVDRIINQATATSNESGAALGHVTNGVPILHDLEIEKVVDTVSSPCTVGTCEVTYRITVTNAGRNAETAIEVTDLLPTDLQYLSYSSSQGSYSNATGVWSVGNLGSSSYATLQLVARVTGYSSSIQNCASLTASTPLDTNPANNTYCAGITPTRIFLTGFRAYEEQGHIKVEWTTSSENGTAGFYLFRRDDNEGVYQRVNKRILPALLTSPAGGTYSLIDQGASPARRYTYILAEIESRGPANVYGPFTVGAGAMVDLQHSGISPRFDPKLLFTFTEKASGDITKTVTEDGVEFSNRNAVRIEAEAFSDYRRVAKEYYRTGEPALKSEQLQPAALRGNRFPSDAAIRIPVRKDGLYSLSASTIASLLKVPETIVKSRITTNGFSLSNRGQQVAFAVEGNQDILFYAKGMDSIYTDENMYWLSPVKGLRMETVGTSRLTPVKGLITFQDSTAAEEDRIAVPVLFSNPEADYWFWDVVVAGDPEPAWSSKSFFIEADGVAGIAETATLTINLHGFTNTDATPDHHASVYLKNGETETFIGEGEWEGSEAHQIIVPFDQQMLRNGRNTIVIKGVLNGEVPYSIFYVDSLELTYQRLYRSSGNVLACTGDGNATVTITGFSGPDVRLFEITDAMKPKLVIPKIARTPDGNYAASFLPGSPDARYLAALRSAAAPITEAYVTLSSGLRAGSNCGEYVVITTPHIEAASNFLAAYRKNQGLASKVVLLQDIMNEFNHGIYSPKAIGDFLSFAYESWEKRPKYVVLAGNGTYDYKDNLGYGDNLVPTLMAATPMGLYPADGLYADFDNDHVPEIAIGRLPVLNAEGMNDITNKIIAYEASARNRVIMAADEPDGGGDFLRDSEEISAMLPPHYAIEKIYLSDRPLAEARWMLLKEMNRGAGFVNYFGHAGPDRLGAEGLLTKEDVLSMGKGLHVLTAMTCLVGQYAIPGYDSLSESLVLKKGVASAAVLAPSGYSLDSQARLLDAEFFRAACYGRDTLLGDAILTAFREYLLAGGQTFMLNIYNLLGDPALKLR